MIDMNEKVTFLESLSDGYSLKGNERKTEV